MTEIETIEAEPGPTASPRYVCENCGLLGSMSAFQEECTPGWTHGRLIRVTSEVGNPVVDALDQAVDALELAVDVIQAEDELPPQRAVLTAKLAAATRELRAKVSAAIEEPAC